MLPSDGREVIRASSREKLLSDIRHDLPGCLITDRRECDGKRSLLAALAANHDVVKLIAVGKTISVTDAISLVRFGTFDVLAHPLDQQSLLVAIDRAMTASQRQLSDAMKIRELRERWNSLTPEEQSITKLLLAGKTSQAIAKSLDVSTRTVDRRRRTIVSTMKVGSLPELAFLLGKYDGHW